MSATILKPYRALPPYIVTQDDVKASIGPVFGLDETRLQGILSVVHNSQVLERRLVLPVEAMIEPRPLSETTREYQRYATQYGRQAACGALSEAGISAAEIDLIITVSCTGLMIPSLDAYLINELGMRPGTRRLPVTELGCAAGAAALSRAYDFIRAWPDATVLIVAVELPSLTFQRHDSSPAHLISCTLFGDGAAAVIVSGKPCSGARILATASHLFPQTYDAMGFDLRDSGLHIVLSKHVPVLIRNHIRPLAETFLATRGLSPSDMRFWWLHPGGQRVLTYMEQELDISAEDTWASHEVLARYGNLSSVTVLYIVTEALNRAVPASGEKGLMAAFGPGFSAEMLLLEWV